MNQSKTDVDRLNENRHDGHNLIDENKLNELEQEASNFADVDEEFYNYAENVFERNNYQNANELELRNLKMMEIENLNLKLLDENEKFRKKIVDYQKTNKDWENKIQNIKLILLDLEDKNKSLKDENEKLKEEMESLQFKMKLAAEREKLQDNNIKNLKEIQTEYENKETELKRDFKIKEENLKKKNEKIEEVLNLKLKEQEREFTETSEKSSEKLKEANKTIEKLQYDLEILRQKLNQTENFFKLKEQEFEDIVNNKDRKLKELEFCIKSISDEANCQILKLSESVRDFNDKINYYKQREIELTNEFKNLRQGAIQNSQAGLNSQFSSTINLNSITERISNERNKFLQDEQSNENKFQSATSTFDSSECLLKNKTIDKLRSRIKEIEEENVLLTRELNLKSEEFETLNEELRRSYEVININETNTSNMIRMKEDEILNLTNKINELDMIINKYGANLINLKKAYDKTSYDHKNEIDRKNSEFKHMKEKYEKKIKNLQYKIEEILVKENAFIQNFNSNSNSFTSNYNVRSNTKGLNSHDSFAYLPKNIPDDEEVRRNINDQINFIKQKLDNHFYG